MAKGIRFVITPVWLLVLALFAIDAEAIDRQSSNYNVAIDEVTVGGGAMASAQYGMADSAVGQALPAGNSASASYLQEAGVVIPLFAPSPTPTATPTATPTSTPTETPTLTPTPTSTATETPTATPTNVPPSASLSTDPQEGAAPLLVSLVGGATDTDGLLVLQQWSFYSADTVDATAVIASATMEDVTTHVYLSPGVYEAAYRVTDDRGGVASATGEIRVWTPTPTTTPSLTPTSTQTPTNTPVDTPTLTPTNTPIPTATWTSPPTETSTPTATSTATSTPTATNTPIATPTRTATPTNAVPTVSLSANPAEGPAPLVVRLVGSATDTDGLLVLQQWSFYSPDTVDATSVLSVPTARVSVLFTYGAAGVYEAAYRVTDDRGGVVSATREIHVWTPGPTFTPTASATPSPSPTEVDTPTPEPTATFTPAATSTFTPSPTPSSTPPPGPTSTRTPTPSPTPTRTATRTPTATATPSSTPTGTPVATSTPTATATPRPKSADFSLDGLVEHQDLLMLIDALRSGNMGKAGLYDLNGDGSLDGLDLFLFSRQWNQSLLTMVIEFPDAYLDQAVRDAISVPTEDIQYLDLLGLTDLTARYRGIVNLEGLQYCPSLANLDLTGNAITQIAPLVDNAGLGDGDAVVLQDNPLSETCLNEQIPALEARGVTVSY